ncbi:hypothetical protein [Ktedonosporobacter rubrisoli]|uniref:hypothetical protein n=1 Tax=Ktedonosporobacter rubrisoli TaxID=2509675 RepID=UPI0013EEA855|nr:hypothetical protein [Ktedonosporobacter rubrisoli]
MSEGQNADEQEMLALSDDFFSIDELEERIELSTMIVDTLCFANACGANGCAGNVNW